MNIKDVRVQLGVSQSRLARMAGISRFKLCMFELENGSLTMDEQNQVKRALANEADRLRAISNSIDSQRDEAVQGQ